MNLWLQRLWIQLTADRKRFGALCVMVAIGLLLWARVILVSKPPRTAVADEVPQTVAAASENQTGRSAGDKVQRVDASRQRVAITLADRPSRDPFRISDVYFPEPTHHDINMGNPEKSGSDSAENTPDPDALRTGFLRSLAAKLELEAVMTGRPMAIINGRTYQIGDQIAVPGEDAVSFELLEIGIHSAVVGTEGRRFDLQMNTPMGPTSGGPRDMRN